MQTADDVINFKFFLDQPLKQWLTGREKGRFEFELLQKFEYREKEKSFLDEIKTFFIACKGLSFGKKKKKIDKK